MSDGEVAAYLAGVEIGRNASVLTLDHSEVDSWEVPGGSPPVPEACKGMSSESFRSWLLRGVGDAFKQ